MNKKDVLEEIRKTIKEFGIYPMDFFNILHETENPNINFDKQNRINEDIKSEKWHSLILDEYFLWSITDNGDLIWWNGEQTIAMTPRDFEYMSLPVNPLQFIRLVGMGKVIGIFPKDLWE